MTPEPLMVMGQVELFPVILLRRQQLHGASLLLKIMEFFYSKYSSGSGGDRSTVTTSYVPFSGAKAQTIGGVTSGGSIWGSTGGGSISGTASGTVSGTTSASGVSGSLRNGAVSRTVAAGGGNPTDYTGEAETAPDHVYVRCLIRAKP